MPVKIWTEKPPLAPSDSTYTQRLNKIASALGDNINGQPVNYKVYMAKDVNAFAMANGCIRVYSGLMDMMTDNEVEAVIGHEWATLPRPREERDAGSHGHQCHPRSGSLCRRYRWQPVAVTAGRRR